MRLHKLCVFVVFAAAGGCYSFHTREEAAAHANSVRPNSTCAVRNFQAVEQLEPVDMVWVVDNSSSMEDEQARIRQTINQFVADVAARQFDVRLVMITREDLVPPPLGQDGERYLFVPRRVASNEPLIALIDELPRYRDFLRRDAGLHFVVVTDDDSSVSAEQFSKEINVALERPFVLHSVASPDVDGAPCRNSDVSCEGADPRQSARRCGAASIGREYAKLAQRSGGEEISICVSDWSLVFGPLLSAVGRREIPCQIEIPARERQETEVTLRPRGVSALGLLRVESERQCGQLAAFYFVTRAATEVAQLVLCPAACTLTRTPEVELRIVPGCFQDEPE